MANVVQPSALEYFAAAWLTDTIKVALISAGYTYSPSHTVISDVPGGDIVATSGALAGKTATNGVLDADDITISSLTGSVVTQMWVYDFTNNKLLVYINQAAGLPITPSGADEIIEWNPAGIAQI